MLPAQARADRAAAARNWLASLTLPPAIRTALAKLVDATGGEPMQLSATFTTAVTSIESHLDSPARLELDRLSRAIER
jgi:hypothetical protein